MTKNQKIILVGLFILFFILRFPGLSLPYHQDEAKVVTYSETVSGAGELFAHPPLMQIFFVAGSYVFGSDYFRLLPIFFGFLSVLVLYLFIRDRFGYESAVSVSFVYAICFYNIWGSLQLDVDGSMLPFFFLLSVYAYGKVKSSESRVKTKWIIFLIVTFLLGWLVKLNFILAILAICADCILFNWKNFTVKKATYAVLAGLGFVALYIALLYLIQALYPAFRIDAMMNHANQFKEQGGRNYMQVLVQGVKAIYYLSPLLLIPLFFVSKDILKKASVFILYLIFGLAFYFVIFDFSRGALDKYLMFLTLPLAVVCGLVLDSLLKKFKEDAVLMEKIKPALLWGAGLSFLLVSLNFLPHLVVPLYPKTLWFSRVLHGDWNILTPFNGGSGPVGFYVSFLFIAFSFLISFACVVLGFWKKEKRPLLAVVIVFVGLIYNGVFASELLFGSFFGSSEKVLQDSISFIKKDDSIKQVLTFNNTGSFELLEIGKYSGRIYATPEFAPGNLEKFASFQGQYLIVEIPKLYGVYRDFFDGCKVLFETNSGEIRGWVYNCPDSAKRVKKLQAKS